MVSQEPRPWVCDKMWLLLSWDTHSVVKSLQKTTPAAGKPWFKCPNEKFSGPWEDKSGVGEPWLPPGLWEDFWEERMLELKSER